MYNASEKLAIIRLVEDSGLSVSRTLDEVKVSRTSIYRWYAADEEGELDGLANQGRASRCHWNRIPDLVRSMIVDVALNRPDLMPRELAWHITDTHDYFVSESSVYRILKAHDLITSPQFMVMSDVYEGRRDDILDQRAIIKSRTMMRRKVQNLRLAG